MDTVSSEKRSWVMARIKSGNTSPERKVRSLLHRMGYRFRIHCKKLPGKPDIVLPKWKSVIFVNGCFWHRHDCKSGSRIPATRQEYWIPKLQRNRLRDLSNIALLEKMGWNILVIWECELKRQDLLYKKINDFFK